MASEEEIVAENELTRPRHRLKVRRDSKAFSAASRLSRRILYTLHRCCTTAGKIFAPRNFTSRRSSSGRKTRGDARREGEEAARVLIPECTIWRAFRGFRLQIISLAANHRIYVRALTSTCLNR